MRSATLDSSFDLILDSACSAGRARPGRGGSDCPAPGGRLCVGRGAVGTARGGDGRGCRPSGRPGCYKQWAGACALHCTPRAHANQRQQERHDHHPAEATPYTGPLGALRPVPSCGLALAHHWGGGVMRPQSLWWAGCMRSAEGGGSSGGEASTQGLHSVEPCRGQRRGELGASRMRGGGGGNGRRQGWSGVERGVGVGVQKQ